MNYNLLVNTMSIQTESYNSKFMERFLKRFLKKNQIPYHTDAYGNIYATKGNAGLYPTMVSHIDTVHEINMNSVVKRHNDILYSIDDNTMERTGIGGDDKVGVFITMSCLLHFDNFKAVFFKDEEVGCVGSSQCDATFFDDSTVVLQCDRKGMGDFVKEICGVELCDNKLLNDIDDVLNHYERKAVSGGLTDVKSIAQVNDVQCANINCGYYDPHTDNEFISISDVENTLNFCIDVFTITDGTRYTMKRTYTTYGYSKSTYKAWNDYYGWEDEIYPQGLKTSPHKEVYGQTCSQCDGIDTAYDPYMHQNYCYTCNIYTDYETSNEIQSQSSTN